MIKNRDTQLGDFGNVLMTGILSINTQGELEIVRCGRDMPSICIVGAMYLVVNNKFKFFLEKENFSGFEFERINKKKIIDIEWIKWVEKKEIGFYPQKGEPESYFEENAHSEELDGLIGEIWLLKLNSNGIFQEDKYFYDYKYDFCEPKNRYSKIISKDAKNWIVKEGFDEWIQFERVEKSYYNI